MALRWDRKPYLQKGSVADADGGRYSTTKLSRKEWLAMFWTRGEQPRKQMAESDAAAQAICEAWHQAAKPLIFEILADVLAHRFVGNARDDMRAFDAVTEFVERPTTSPHEALRAEVHASVAGMGIEPSQLDPIAAEAHAKNVAGMREAA